MDPRSQQIIQQILEPSPMGSAPVEQSASAPFTMEQIVQPGAPASSYTGPERRAQGYLIAEEVVEPQIPRGAEPPSDSRL